MAEGFRQAGLRSIYAVEIDRAAAETYWLNFGHQIFVGPIERLRRVPVRADVVIGGPPCQGFSLLGRMSPTDDHPQMNQLWRHFMRIVREVRPLAFVMENVPGLLRSTEFVRIQRAAEKLGYHIAAGVLNAADFGVPQNRRRGFIIGLSNGTPSLPVPTGERATVRDAIGDLSLEPTGKDWHIGRDPTPISRLRYKYIPPGGNRFDLMRKRPDLVPNCWKEKPTGSTDVFGRLEWNKPAPTIRTEFFKPEKGRYLHPQAHRPITHREAARLQTFPDSFIFFGSKIEVAKQIGNAVPPKLARVIAEAVKKALGDRCRTRLSTPHRVAGMGRAIPQSSHRSRKKSGDDLSFCEVS